MSTFIENKGNIMVDLNGEPRAIVQVSGEASRPVGWSSLAALKRACSTGL